MTLKQYAFGIARLFAAFTLAVIGAALWNWQNQFWEWFPDGAEGYNELVEGAPSIFMIYGAWTLAVLTSVLMIRIMYRRDYGIHTGCFWFAMVMLVNIRTWNQWQSSWAPDQFFGVIMALAMVALLYYTGRRLVFPTTYVPRRAHD